jgi:hypothetical protein
MYVCVYRVFFLRCNVVDVSHFLVIPKLHYAMHTMSTRARPALGDDAVRIQHWQRW